MESARTLATNFSGSNSGSVLPGKYKQFFLPDAHDKVHDWYYKRANAAQRHVFKQLVKDVIDFDATTAEGHLRPTYQTDLVQSSALVNANGGQLLSAAMQDKCSVYLSFQKRSKHQQFRETFGVIDPPRTSMLPTSQTKLDFRPARVVGRVPTEDALFRSNNILASDKIKKPSDVTTAECEVIGPMGVSSYGTMFPWKVAPKAKNNILQKAHDASIRGAPWGATEPVDGQWITHTRQAFAGHEYRFDQAELLKELEKSAGPPEKKKYISGPGNFIGKRRFQNYNDNYCDALLYLDRQRRKGLVQVPSDQEVEASVKRRYVPAVASCYASRNSPLPKDGTTTLPSIRRSEGKSKSVS